ncbi:MAG: hypothetical protein HW410_444 [Nitrosarchaeum sp.]|jgi:hypothetical protein|nr:hypothetical protein [Nitrosarchaeum sp.]
MDSKIVLFVLFSLATIFTIFTPIDTAVAQDTETTPDVKEHKGESHEGKSCPSKENIPTNIAGNL